MSAGGGRRTARGGRIDRSKPVMFSFDGQRYLGYQGDTLAAALLASGVRLFGRSFKYHRPRGVYSAGVEEPCALVTLGEDARREPNISATTTEIFDGLTAQSQNRWPSLKFDVMAVNQLAGPLFSAGFYYKTFMGPGKGTRSWMFYEKFIRRAAGLGTASGVADPDRYETRHMFADVLVIGSGPAGIAAALAAGRAGARVLLVEQDFAFGGSLLAEACDGPGGTWLVEQLAELARLENVILLSRTTAYGLYDSNTVGLIERHDAMRPDPTRGQPRQISIIARAKAIVMAAGAIERPLVFNDNDRPGVMLASAARTYINRFGVVPGERAVFATNNDSAYSSAIDLAAAGSEVLLTDIRAHPANALVAAARAAGVDVRPGMAVLGVKGRKMVEGAVIAEVTTDWQQPAVVLETRPADLICVSGGWSPSVHLSSHRGIKPVYREDIAAFVPGGFAAGHWGAGAMMGECSLGEAVGAGWSAGGEAAAYASASGQAGNASSAPSLPWDGRMNIAPAWNIPQSKRGKAFVDIQNDVAVSDLKLAHREGYQSVEHLKRYTTLGMATDQGKTSNINALAIMADLRKENISAVGTTTFRPPYTGVAIGALAGRSVGHHFRPIRRSPLHEWHLANGGVMIEAGAWHRAWYYTSAGRTVGEAYVAEMKHVRGRVGLADVSTLGKIDVQGPDAAEFLNQIYVNGFAKLPIGKARYGLMLHDDGLVLDDGTTTRLGEQHYFMTTTTAQAGEVMSWLEFLLQTAWQDLRVHVSSITDEWGAMSLAGPHARGVLEAAFPGVDVSDAALPHMGVKQFAFAGATVRLIRLSFSGELAYEVYTGANQTVALWEHLMQAGRALDLRPYGLEALAALRIEKGHVAGQDLDHRVSMNDLGLAKMANRRKAFIGDQLSLRPALVANERPTLVGIECIEPGGKLRGGSILFDAADEIKGHGRGHISSVTYSPELGRYIALGFYKGGLENIGREVVCAFPVKNEQVRGRIVSPHFIDPRGDRLNAT